MSEERSNGLTRADYQALWDVSIAAMDKRHFVERSHINAFWEQVMASPPASETEHTP